MVDFVERRIFDAYLRCLFVAFFRSVFSDEWLRNGLIFPTPFDFAVSSSSVAAIATHRGEYDVKNSDCFSMTLTSSTVTDTSFVLLAVTAFQDH